jgi:hypothetical protein
MTSDKIHTPHADENAAAHEKHEYKDTIFVVSVNDHPVRLLGRQETGVEIKTAAIEQGVEIILNFVLEEELADGTFRVIKDNETIHLHENLKFIAREHEIVISVNEQPVKLQAHSLTGAEIKAAAIAQGVLIQPNFVLQEELPNGTSKIVGDNDRVRLRQHLRFTAIAPDDNS